MNRESKERKWSDTMQFFLAGNVAGIAGVLTGQPFDTIKIRMQTQDQLKHTHSSLLKTMMAQNLSCAQDASMKFSSSWDCFRSTVKNNGFMSLYRGMALPIISVGFHKAVAFSVYEKSQQFLVHHSIDMQKRKKKEEEKQASMFQLTIAGMFAGMVNAMILTPIDQFKISMQVQKYEIGYRPDIFYTIRTLMKEQGLFRGVYGNLNATLLREIPMYGVYYSTYAHLNRRFLSTPQNKEQGGSRKKDKEKENDEFPFLLKMLLGGITGVFTWATCYPLDLIKSAMVTQTAQNLKERKSIQEMIRAIYEQGGHSYRAFYKGMGPALCRALPSHAVVFTVYDYIIKLTT